MAVLAILHLVSVAGVLLVNTGRGSSAVSAALRTYQSFAGTWRDYAFFAPDVASDYKAGFVLDDDAGTSSTLVDLGGASREISFRYDSMIASCMADAGGREVFAQSWAALLLGARPDAARVTVMVKRLNMPGMAAYRAGRRAAWEIVYAGTFDRRPHPATR